MAYTKQNFEDGQVLEAEHLNRMEDGIAKANGIIVEKSGDTLTWDGNTEGLVNAGGELFKVSDAILTSETFSGGGLLQMFSYGQLVQQLELNSDSVLEGGGATLIRDMIWSISDAAVNVDIDGLIFPEAGLYFPNFSAGEEGVSVSLTINDYTGFITKEINTKYLPEAVTLYTDGTYIYNTDDTSDESNRTTKAQMLKYLNSGRIIRLYAGGMYYMPSLGIGNTYGLAAIVGGTGTASVDIFYTAEYTVS